MSWIKYAARALCEGFAGLAFLGYGMACALALAGAVLGAVWAGWWLLQNPGALLVVASLFCLGALAANRG